MVNGSFCVYTTWSISNLNIMSTSKTSYFCSSASRSCKSDRNSPQIARTLPQKRCQKSSWWTNHKQKLPLYSPHCWSIHSHNSIYMWTNIVAWCKNKFFPLLEILISVFRNQQNQHKLDLQLIRTEYSRVLHFFMSFGEEEGKRPSIHSRRIDKITIKRHG